MQLIFLKNSPEKNSVHLHSLRLATLLSDRFSGFSTMLDSKITAATAVNCSAREVAHSWGQEGRLQQRFAEFFGWDSLQFRLETLYV